MEFQEDSRVVGSGAGRWGSIGRTIGAVALLLCAMVDVSFGQTFADIRNTRHNLSKDGSFTVKASTETEVCVFCHTPHSSNTGAAAPLWNRNGSGKSYTPYTSSSMDSTAGQPAGSSLMCLSCHDGTVALGNVRVLRGNHELAKTDTWYGKVITDPTKVSITFDSTLTNPGGVNPAGGDDMALGGMPQGPKGADTGFTRLLGTDLSNDHPISISYSTAYSKDGELRAVADIPTLKLPNGQVQCPSCHDPHITKTKFLRLNRLQKNNSPSTTDTAFNTTNDIICLACHTKGGKEWAQSVHASDATATYDYDSTAAALREFDRDSATVKVWQAACLNCHDTHTVPGAKRLLREGTDSTSSPKKKGNPALEETCYQCHRTAGPTNGNILATTTAMTATTGVPDIKTEFEKPNGSTTGIRMPIKTGDQGGGGTTATDEFHDITNADFIEPISKLGATSSRHVECTDCHNPHRVVKNALFTNTGTVQRTHVAGGTTANNGADGNIASGVLRGAWGVEPTYSPAADTWPEAPNAVTGYTVKKGIPASTSTAKTADHLTREYQLCFKCHSNYSVTTFANLRGNTYGGTASSTNGMTKYTNVAAEYSVYANDSGTGADQCEAGNATGCDPAATNGSHEGSPNHRSWHPVVFPTGRIPQERTGSSSTKFTNIRYPFNNQSNVGKQTMHCSDCHGNSASWTQGSSVTDASGNPTTTGGPDLTKVQGPHGSDKNFLLKGIWDDTVTPNGVAGSNTIGAICGRCHDPKNGNGGFSNNSGAGHNFTPKNSRWCMTCHVAVPHGWKNKAFLVNLNCIQGEGGSSFSSTCTSANTPSNPVAYTLEPYYYRAALRILTWSRSSAWQEGNCGTSSLSGKDWMSAACYNK